MADDVLSAEQVARYNALDKRWLPGYWQDVVDLCRSHEALRVQLAAEQSSRMAAECDLVDTRQQVETLRERLENAERAVAEMTPEGFSEAMRVAIEDRERAEAALGQALAAIEDLSFCPICGIDYPLEGAAAAIHDAGCLWPHPAGASALARLRRLETVAEALRGLFPLYARTMVRDDRSVWAVLEVRSEDWLRLIAAKDALDEGKG